MSPEKIPTNRPDRLTGTVPIDNYGERNLCYNPVRKLKNDVYILTINRLLLIIPILLFGCRTTPSPTVDRELETKIEEIIAPKKARIGVAVVWNHRTIVAVNDDSGYPLMSVMKFHQALAVTDVLSRNRTSLDTTLRIERNDLKPDTWSPLRNRYPSGVNELSVRSASTASPSRSRRSRCTPIPAVATRTEAPLQTWLCCSTGSSIKHRSPRSIGISSPERCSPALPELTACRPG